MSEFSRKPIIAGNWKCNPATLAEVNAIIERLNNGDAFPPNADVVIGVPSMYLLHAKANFRSDIFTCAEDIGLKPGVGACTGEICSAMLKDAGIGWTIVGHSERRVGFGIPGETNELVGKKTKVGVDAGLNVIACIGEMLADREAGRTMDVCAAQLSGIAATLTGDDWKSVVIAYEPVWAIGTGKVATPEQAEETHCAVRAWIAENVSPSVANEIRILYGGSVKGSNCNSLITCPNIDGFLVGGASLLPEFADIIKSAA